MPKQGSTPFDPAAAPASPGFHHPRATAPITTVLVAFLGLGIAVIVVAAFHASSRQRPILELLGQMGGADPAQRRAARDALITRPDLHAPVLVSVLRRGRTRWHGQILPWLEGIPQLASRRARQVQLERHAIDVLQRMGPPAAPYILPLLAESRFGGRNTAMALFRAYGPGVCPFLVESLADPRPSVRAGAASTLGLFPSAPGGFLDPLRKAARDPHPTVRAAAIGSLGGALDRADEILPDLIQALSDTAPEVQSRAASSLRFFGPKASAAVASLRRCLAESVGPVQVEAAMTLAAIGGDAAQAAGPELLGVLRRRDGPPARQAAVTLVQLNLHCDEALARLKASLNHHDATLRIRTLDALRGVGPSGRPLVPDILAILENPDERDNRSALLTLRGIDPEAVPERFRPRRRSP